MDSLQLDVGDVSLEVHRYSATGTMVCLLPGLGGGIRRFHALGELLCTVGLQPVAINPRGAGTSTGRLDGLTIRDLAGDVAGVVEHVGGPAIGIGNAVGHRVARYLAPI
ncbi:MAG: alpha/beta hydrolase, partial [Actinomycetota bacterium]